MAAHSSTGAEKEGGGQATLESHLPELGMSVPELVLVDSNNVAGKSSSHCNINSGVDEVIVNSASSKALKNISSSPSNKSSDSKEFHSASECKKKRRRRKGDKILLHSVENSSSSSCSRKKADEKEEKSSSKVALAQYDGAVYPQCPEETLLDEEIHIKNVPTGCSTEDILFQQNHVKQSKSDSDSSGSTLSDVFVNQLLTEPCHPVPEATLRSESELQDNPFNRQLSSTDDHRSELGTVLNNDFIIQLLLDHMDFVWKKCGTRPHQLSENIKTVLFESNTTVQEEVCKEVVTNLVSNKLNNTDSQMNEQIKITEEDAVSFEHQADRSEYVAKVVIQPLITDIIQAVITTLKNSLNDCAQADQCEEKSSDTSSGCVVKKDLGIESQQLCVKDSAVLSLAKLNVPLNSYELRFHNQSWMQSTSGMTDPNNLHSLKADNFKRSKRVRTVAMNNNSERVTRMRRSIDFIYRVIVARLNFALGACGQPHKRLPFYVRPLIFDGKHLTMEEIYNELELEITETSSRKATCRCFVSETQSDFANAEIVNNNSPSEVAHLETYTNCEHGNSISNTNIVQFIESLLLDVVLFSTFVGQGSVCDQENNLDTNILSTNVNHDVSIPGLHELPNNKKALNIHDATFVEKRQPIIHMLESSSPSFNGTNEELLAVSDVIGPITNDTSLNRQFASTNLLKTISTEKFGTSIEHPVDCRSKLEGDMLRMQTSSSIDILSMTSETFYPKQHDLENISEGSINTQQHPSENRHGDSAEDSGLSQSDSESSSNSLEMFVRESNEDISVNAWSGSDSSTQIVNARKLYTIHEVSCESNLNEEAGFAVTKLSDESLYDFTADQLSTQLTQNNNDNRILVQYVKDKNNAGCTIKLPNSETSSISSSDSSGSGNSALNNAGFAKLAKHKSSHKMDSVTHGVMHTERAFEHSASSGSISTEYSDLDVRCADSGENNMYDPSCSEVPLTSRETIQYFKPTVTDGIQTDISFGELLLPGHNKGGSVLDSSSSLTLPFSEAYDSINDEYEVSPAEAISGDVSEVRVLADQIKCMRSHSMQTAMIFTDELIDKDSSSSLTEGRPNSSADEVYTATVVGGTDPSICSSIPTTDIFQQNIKRHLPTTLIVKQPDPLSEVLDEVCRDLTFISKGVCSQSNTFSLQKMLVCNNITTGGGTLSSKVLISSINESGSSSITDILPNKANEVYSSGDGTKTPTPTPSIETFVPNPALHRIGYKALNGICEHTKLAEYYQEASITENSNKELLCNSQAKEVNLNKLNLVEKNVAENICDTEQSILEKLTKHASEVDNSLDIRNNAISTTNTSGIPVELCEQAYVQAQGTYNADDKQSILATEELGQILNKEIRLKEQIKDKACAEQIHSEHVNGEKICSSYSLENSSFDQKIIAPRNVDTLGKNDEAVCISTNQVCEDPCFGQEQNEMNLLTCSGESEHRQIGQQITAPIFQEVSNLDSKKVGVEDAIGHVGVVPEVSGNGQKEPVVSENISVQTLPDLEQAEENEFASFPEENCVQPSSAIGVFYSTPNRLMYAMEAGVVLDEDLATVNTKISLDGAVNQKTVNRTMNPVEDISTEGSWEKFTSYKQDVSYEYSCPKQNEDVLIEAQMAVQTGNNADQHLGYTLNNTLTLPISFDDASDRKIPDVLCTLQEIYADLRSEKGNCFVCTDTKEHTMGDAKISADKHKSDVPYTVSKVSLDTENRLVCNGTQGNTMIDEKISTGDHRCAILNTIKEVDPEVSSETKSCLTCVGIQGNNMDDTKVSNDNVSDDKHNSDVLYIVKEVDTGVCSETEIDFAYVDPQIDTVSKVKVSTESQKRVLFEVSSEEAFSSESNSNMEPSCVSIHTAVLFAEGDSQRDTEFQHSDLVASSSSLKQTLLLKNTIPQESVNAKDNVYVVDLPKTIRYLGTEKYKDNGLQLYEGGPIVAEVEVESTKRTNILEDEEINNIRPPKVDVGEVSAFVGAESVGAKDDPTYGDECKSMAPYGHKLSTASNSDTQSSSGFEANTSNKLGLAVAFSNRNIFEDICNEADTCTSAECAKPLANDPVFNLVSERPSAGYYEVTSYQIYQSVCDNQHNISTKVDPSPGMADFTLDSNCEQPKIQELPQPLELSSYENVISIVAQSKLSSSEDNDSECESLFEISALVEEGQGGAAALGNNSSFEIIPNEHQSPSQYATRSSEDVLTPHLTSSNEDLLSKVTENDASESVSLSEVMHVESNSELNVDTTAPHENKEIEALPAIATWSYENLHHRSSAVIQQSLSTSSECLHIGITSLLKSSPDTSNENEHDNTSPESTDSSYENVHARVIIEQPSSSTSSENSTRVVIWSAGLSPKATSTESVQIEDVPTSTISSYENVQSDGLLIQLPSSSSSSSRDSMQQAHDSSVISSSKATSHESIHCANLSPSPVSSFENVVHEDLLTQTALPSTVRQNENIPRSATTLSTGSFEALAARGSSSLHSATSHNSIILQSCSSGSSTCLYRSHARDFSGLMEYVGKLNSLTSGRDSSGDLNSLAAQRSLSTPVVDTAHSTTSVDESKSEAESVHSSRSYNAAKNKVSCVELDDDDDDDQDQSNSNVLSKLNALRRFMPFTCFMSPSSSDNQIDEPEQSSTSQESNSKIGDKIGSTFNILDQELD